jgi:hypothetical protein
MSTAVGIATLWVALLFLASGLGKLLNGDEFAAALRNVGLPALANRVAPLAVAELAVAVGLLFAPGDVALAAAAAYIALATPYGMRLARGTGSCGCFGRVRSGVGPASARTAIPVLLARNSLVAAVLGAASMGPIGLSGADGPAVHLPWFDAFALSAAAGILGALALGPAVERVRRAGSSGERGSGASPGIAAQLRPS